ncbi:MAG: hypothetical protein FWC49_06030 [Proteobacteria bacterium]|nr:hypothetical protein [Pseudomonadota bacterium]
MLSNTWVLSWRVKQAYKLGGKEISSIKRAMDKDDIALWSEPFLALIGGVSKSLLHIGDAQALSLLFTNTLPEPLPDGMEGHPLPPVSESYNCLCNHSGSFQDAVDVVTILMTRYPAQAADAYKTAFLPTLYGDNDDFCPHEGTVFKNIIAAISDAALFRKTAVIRLLAAMGCSLKQDVPGISFALVDNILAEANHPPAPPPQDEKPAGAETTRDRNRYPVTLEGQGEMYSVSRSTIQRWINGQNAPEDYPGPSASMATHRLAAGIVKKKRDLEGKGRKAKRAVPAGNRLDRAARNALDNDD